MRAGDEVPFVARFPSSVVGEVAHVVPQQGVTAAEGWVRTVVTAVERGTPRGQAEWALHFTENSRRTLTVRIRNQSVEHTLVVGTPIYEAPIACAARGASRRRSYSRRTGRWVCCRHMGCPEFRDWAAVNACDRRVVFHDFSPFVHIHSSVRRPDFARPQVYGEPGGGGTARSRWRQAQ